MGGADIAAAGMAAGAAAGDAPEKPAIDEQPEIKNSALLAPSLLERYRKFVTDSATRVHPLGLRSSTLVTKQDLLRAVKYLGRKAKLAICSLERTSRTPCRPWQCRIAATAADTPSYWPSAPASVFCCTIPLEIPDSPHSVSVITRMSEGE